MDKSGRIVVSFWHLLFTFSRILLPCDDKDRLIKYILNMSRGNLGLDNVVLLYFPLFSLWRDPLLNAAGRDIHQQIALVVAE